jgi:hypothetical protein
MLARSVCIRSRLILESSSCQLCTSHLGTDNSHNSNDDLLWSTGVQWCLALGNGEHQHTGLIVFDEFGGLGGLGDDLGLLELGPSLWEDEAYCILVSWFGDRNPSTANVVWIHFEVCC